MATMKLSEHDITNGRATVPAKALWCSEPIEHCAILLADKDGAARRIQIRANSGREFAHWYWGKAVVDMDTLQVGDQRKSILREHDVMRIVGASDAVEVDGDNALQVTGHVTDKTADGREIAALLAEGHPFQASVYVPPGQGGQIRLLTENEVKLVNGREVVGPAAVIEGAVLREVSVCVLGADPDTASVGLADGDVVDVAVLGGVAPRVCADVVADGRGAVMADEVKEQEAAEEPAAPEAEDDEKEPEAVEATEAVVEEVASEEDGEVDVELSERERCGEIVRLAQSFGLHAEIPKLILDGVTVEQATSRLKDLYSERLAAETPKDPGPNGDPNELTSGPSEAAPLSERCKWAWDRNASLHVEFPSYEHYVSFCEHEGFVEK